MFPLLWITPFLAIGNDWPDDYLDADAAVEWVQDGRHRPVWAVVPDQATACEVLRRLGLNEEAINDRIRFALG